MLLLKNSKFQTIVTNIPTDGSEKIVDLSPSLRLSNNGSYLATSRVTSTIAGISVRIVDYKHVSRESGGVLRVNGPSSSSILVPISPSSPDYSAVSSEGENELLYVDSSEITRVVSGDFRFRLSFDPWTHSSAGAFGRNFFSRLVREQPIVIPRTTPGPTGIEIDIIDYFNNFVPSSPSPAVEEAELARLYLTGSNNLGFISNVVVTVAGSLFDSMLTRASLNSSPVLFFEPSTTNEALRVSYSAPGTSTKEGRDSVYTKFCAKVWVTKENITPLTAIRVDLNYYGVVRTIYPNIQGIPVGIPTDPLLEYRTAPSWTSTSTIETSAGGAVYLADIPTSLSSVVVEAKILFNTEDNF